MKHSDVTDERTAMEKPEEIRMVDLRGQYLRLRDDIGRGWDAVMESCRFINGPEVSELESALARFTGARHVVACGNGTDALRIALTALDLRPGDEVIVPAFAYAACAEVVCMAGLVPVPADVDAATFNLTPESAERVISPRTRVLMPVHLFGQPCDMEGIMELARRYGLKVIEDNAQSLGARCPHRDGSAPFAGTVGTIGCTSFFPTKNLGCYGDGGAMFTDDDGLARRIRMIANHGQEEKYTHRIVGCNSRLDTLQAVVLNVKLPHLPAWNEARRRAAAKYSALLGETEGITLPKAAPGADHVWHQYTLRVAGGERDRLRQWLASRGIPTMIYYPRPLHLQKAYRSRMRLGCVPEVAERLCGEVLSLPMHTELTDSQIEYIGSSINEFFAGSPHRHDSMGAAAVTVGSPT